MSSATQTPPPSERTLQEKIEHLGDLVRDPKSDLGSDELPHLPELIDDWYNTDVDVTKEEFHQRMLRVFKDSKHKQVYNGVMNQLPSETRKVLEAFIEGDKTADQAGKAIKEVAPLELGVSGISSHVQTFSMMAQQVTPPTKTKDYKEEIAEFQTFMAAIGKKHGWTLGDIKRTFSNDVLDNTFLGGVATSTPQQVAKSEKIVQVQVHQVPVDNISEVSI